MLHATVYYEMKRLPFYLLILAALAAGCSGGPSPAGSSTLDQAIQIAAEEVNNTLGAGKTAAVINFNSSSVPLSEYVVEELTGALVRGGKLVITDRRNLELIREEMNFQLSGEVSDESAQAIGKILGAEYIITGSLSPLGANYRFRVYALSVESAARETATMVTVKNEPNLSYLLYVQPVKSPF
jgi:acetylglutamate kinase